MNQKNWCFLLITSLFLLVSCGSDTNETNKTSESNTSLTNVSNKRVKDTFLQGKIVGDMNGKEFTHYNEKERPGKIRETNIGKSLNITFLVDSSILTINLHAYNGADAYVSGGNFKLISFKDPKAVFKNKDNSKITIIEDNDSQVKGSISFATVSAENEEILINATFDLTKIIIDLNDPEALLKEIKENPSSIESLDGLKSDKAFMLKAISINPLAFRYADKSLKGDKAFILSALQDNPSNFLFFTYADKEIKSDKDFVLKIVKLNKLVLHLLDKKLKKDKDVIAASMLE